MTTDPDPRIDVLLLAGAILGAGTMLRNGRYHPFALALVVGAVVLLCTQLTQRATATAPTALVRRIRIAYVIQTSVLILSIGRHVIDFAVDNLSSWVVVTSVGTAAWLWGGWDAIRRTPRWAFSLYLCLLGLVIVSLTVLAASPPVAIDVHTFQQVAAERLLEGENPYLQGYPDVYTPTDSRRFYGPGLSVGGILQFGFPYPPLSALLVLPGHLLGGLQLAHLAAIATAGFLLSRLGPDHTSRLGAVFFLTATPTVFLVRQSWTEAFVVLLLVLAVWTHRRGVGRGVAIGLLAVSKQYCLLFVPLYPLLVGGIKRMRVATRALAGAGVVAAAVTVPFVLWDPAAFYRSVVELQFLQPLRTDALSLGSFLALELGWTLPGASILPFVVMAVVTGVALRRAPRTSAGFALGWAVVWTAGLLVSKQAFANYYYAAIAGIFVAVAASTSTEPVDIHDNVDYAE